VVITIDIYLLYRFFTMAKLKLYETQRSEPSRGGVIE